MDADQAQAPLSCRSGIRGSQRAPANVGGPTPAGGDLGHGAALGCEPVTSAGGYYGRVDRRTVAVSTRV